MKSKELKTYNLPEDNQVIASIDAKPNVLFFILIGKITSGRRCSGCNDRFGGRRWRRDA